MITFPTTDPYLAWLMFILMLALGLVIVRIGYRWLLGLVQKNGQLERPSDYREEVIKQRLVSGDYQRPEVSHTGRVGWNRLEAIRRTRPQPRIGSSAGWGDGIHEAQIEKHRKIADRR